MDFLTFLRRISGSEDDDTAAWSGMSPDWNAVDDDTTAWSGMSPNWGGSSYETGVGIPGEEAARTETSVRADQNQYGPAAGGTGTTGTGGTTTIPGAGASAPSALSNLFKVLTQKPDGSFDFTKLAALAAGGAGLSSLLNAQPTTIGPRGFTGTIPTRELVRERVPYAADPLRRPGSSARQYFTTARYVSPADAAAAREAAKAEARGIAGLAEGGMPAAQGRYLGGPTDGMADKLPANIDGKQEARLSHGEFVIPADVVSHLGNGNSDAGAQRLYDMMDRIRKARTGNSKQGKQINPDKYMPK